MMDGAAWWIAAAAAVGAAVAVWRWRAEQAGREAAEGEAVALRDELGRAHEEAEAKLRARAEQGDEVRELRRKLDKAKKRAFAAREERAPLESRVAEAEARVAERDAELARLRDEVVRLGQSAERSEREAERTRGELARRPEAPAVSPEQLGVLEQRAEQAEGAVRELHQKLEESGRECSRYRQRERTHRRLYMVIRGELEIAKDKIAKLEEERSS